MKIKNKNTGLVVDIGEAHQTVIGFHTKEANFYSSQVWENDDV